MDLHLNLQLVHQLPPVPQDYRLLAISRDPLNTPHKTLLNHRPPSNASSGSSTNSASGFSSNVSVKDDPAPDIWGAGEPLGRPGGADVGVACVTFGMIFKKDLNPTWKIYIEHYASQTDQTQTFATTSPTSLKSAHRPIPLLAKKSSIILVPILYPIFSSCLLTSA